MKNKNTIKQSKKDNIFDVFNTIFLVITFALVAYPIVYIISSSISDPEVVMRGGIVLWPVGINFDGYTAVFETDSVLVGYANSFFYASVGTLFNIVFTLLAAYPLSRHEMVGRKTLTFLFTFTMMFSGGLIPTYTLVQSLGLIDTRWSLIFPTLIGVWNMIITKTFFESTIPKEIYEAAEIDGAGDIKTFLKVVLPVSTPIIAVIGLYYAVTHWNAYFDAMLYIKSADLYPLQIPLRNILIVNSMEMSMLLDAEEAAAQQALAQLLKYSLIVVASLPVMCIYPFVQKYFVKGIMVGSVKG